MKNGAPTKVVLLNGQIADTWSNEWREECLARQPLVDGVLKLLGRHNKAARENYYQWIASMYGAEQEKRVRAAVARVWKLGGDTTNESTK